MPEEAEISVLLPFQNAEKYIEEAVLSILAQEEVVLEVLAVDNGSSDGSRQALARIMDPRIRVIEEPRRGVAHAYNAGLSAACGRYFARCDADDLYTPGRLLWQYDWLKRHPDFGAVCGSYFTMSRKGAIVAELQCGSVGEEITQELRGGRTRTTGCAFLTRTELLGSIGGCRPYFVGSSEDIDLQLRLGEACRVWYEPNRTYCYRLHDESLTHSQQKNVRVFYESMAREFQRQRLETGADDLQRGRPPAPPEVSSSPSPAAEQISGMLIGRAWREHEQGEKLRSIRIAIRACAAYPTKLSAWKAIAAVAIKPCRKGRHRI